MNSAPKDGFTASMLSRKGVIRSIAPKNLTISRHFQEAESEKFPMESRTLRLFLLALEEFAQGHA